MNEWILYLEIEFFHPFSTIESNNWITAMEYKLGAYIDERKSFISILMSDFHFFFCPHPFMFVGGFKYSKFSFFIDIVCMNYFGLNEWMKIFQDNGIIFIIRWGGTHKFKIR